MKRRKYKINIHAIVESAIHTTVIIYPKKNLIQPLDSTLYIMWYQLDYHKIV